MAVRVALVLGGAGNVWTDIADALALGTYHGVVACNDIGAAWPARLDCWASLHPEKMGIWAEQRRKAGYSKAKRIVGHLQARTGRIPANVDTTIEFKFPGQVHSGSSGLFALKAALIDEGFDKAVLCGIPMTVKPGHFFDPSHWNGANSHRQGWQEAMPQIKDRARSMSGQTMAWLGAPTKDWLHQP